MARPVALFSLDVGDDGNDADHFCGFVAGVAELVFFTGHDHGGVADGECAFSGFTDEDDVTL